MNKISKKFIAIFISLFLILNIVCNYSIFAATVTSENEIDKTKTTVTTNENGESKVTTESTDGELVGAEDVNVAWSKPTDYAIINNGCLFGPGIITFDDLCSHGDLLCSQRGTLITGSSAADYGSLGESSEGSTHNSSEIPDLTPMRTKAKYELSERMYATPEEAFILAFAQHSEGAIYGEYTPAQIAFWNTPAGQGIASEDGNFIAVSSMRTNTVGNVNAYSDELISISDSNISSAVGNIDSAEISVLEKTLSQTVGNTFDPDKDYNNLNDAAKDFQNYIIKAAGVKDVSEVKRGEDGFFVLNYQPSWVNEKITFENKEYDCTDPEVALNQEPQETTEILVGPFALDYVYHESFAYITNMSIETDDPEHKILEYGTDWEIMNLDSENKGYPLPNTPFYIVIHNKYNATKIKNIHVDFEYTNAKGAFNYFYGEIQQKVTDLETTEDYVERTDADGNVYYEKIYTYSWSIQIGTLPSQRLAGNIDAEIRRFTVPLDRKSKNKAQVEIEKIIVDENGNPIDLGTEDFFDFKLSIKGAMNFEEAIQVEDSENTVQTENIRVKGNSSATSKTYSWEGETAPTFEVKELSWPENYEFVSIEPEKGSLVDGQTIKIIAKNQLTPNTGRLEIIKQAEQSALGSTNLIDSDDVFEFNIHVNGEFKYNDGEYKEQSLTISAKVPADGVAHEVIPDGVIEWYGEETPKYNIEEVNIPTGVTSVSITPSSGNLTSDGVVTATAINRQETEKGSIEIIKTLDNTNAFTKAELEALEFNFVLKVDGYEEENLIAKLSEEVQNEDGTKTYIWRCESSEYEWLVGQNPKYTIKEVNNPEGTKFSVDKTLEANSGNTSITVTAEGISGTLVAGEQLTSGVLENYVVNDVTKQPETGKIKIIKKVDEEILADTEFSFAVTVTGTFEYKGQYFENQTIQLTTSTNNANGYNVIAGEKEYNDREFVVINAAKSNSDVTNGVVGQGEYISEEFIWYGEAPKYIVEENLISQDINHTVTPSEGYLSDIPEGEDLITVTAWNGHDKVGYIHIIKELENADKCTIEYVNSLVFKFKIKVDGYEEFIVSLKPERKDNKWVWEYTSDQFSWRFDENAPNYTIEEVEIPEGVVFVSANGQSTNKIEGTLIENTIADIEVKTTDASFINKVNEKTGYLKIDKKVTHGSLQGKEFKFDVILKGTFSYEGTPYTGEHKIENVVVTGGSSKTLGPITWCGNDAPEYIVEEQDSEIANKVSIQNGAGTVKESSAETASIVTATNEPKQTGGYLEITKQISEGIATDQVFTFEVSIGENAPYTIQLKANETYKSDYIKWFVTEEAPKYEVKEVNIPEDAQLVKINNGTGVLSDDEPVSVVAINNIIGETGRFEVVKEVIPNKYIDTATKYEFEIEIAISGTFQMNDEIHYKEDGDYIYTEKIVVDLSKSYSSTYKSPEITWWGDAPTVNVKEINLPKGWQQVGTPSNNGASITSGEDNIVKFIITNELPVYIEIDLTIDLAGEVWEDIKQSNDKNMLESVPNGKMDANEQKIKGVEVYVYRVVMNNDQEMNRTLAKGYKDNLNSELQFPVYTNMDGIWEAPRIEILSLTEEEKTQGATLVRYDVEFVYDGQTYEPTIFLSKVENNKYVEGNASEYIDASTSQRDNFADKSMAKDFNREEVDNRIQNIYGKTPLNGFGETTGTVSGNENVNDVYYKANVTGNNATRVQSKLITTDENGITYDVFKTKARTSVGGLKYPFDNRTHLANYDVTLTDKGLQQKYIYSATYNYCLHINLGLVRREEADVEAIKDLYSAKVLIDGKEVDYKFNKLADIGKDSVNRHVEIDKSNISYELGLYSTDYYYRAEMYRANAKLYNAVSTFYKSIGRSVEETELEVYLTYKISLYNQSPTYVAEIRTINDYFNTTLGMPIQNVVTRIVNGEEKEVANSSYLMMGDNKSKITWTVSDNIIIGSDNVEYNKMTTDLNNLRLASGERADIYVTFAVEKNTIDGIKDAIELGNKSNIVEISSYGTYYSDGETNAGKIDLDSAPANVNIPDYNEKTWYEDDADASPVLTLFLEEENRAIEGFAWEDKAEDSSAQGNGIRDDGEALIGGLTTELIEKIEFNGVEYDFLWPTSEQLDCLGGKTLEYVTGGFASTIETSRFNTDATSVGQYKFTNVPVGKYVVRFLYGNDKTQLEDPSKASLRPAEALNADGTSYYNSDLIYTSNYDNDLVMTTDDGKLLVQTPAVYNGQDYKSTIYQTGFENMVDSGYVVNEFHDLANGNLKDKLVSDARDSESRRLEMIANSQTITNVNGKVLSTANDAKANHTDLYNDYYMFADTAKLDLDIISKDEKGLDGVNSEEISGTIYSDGNLLVEKEAKAYTVSNIDFGLIERPETAIVLDNQISEIKIETHDGVAIFDAKYDINYKEVAENEIDDKVIISHLPENKYLVAETTLNSSSIGTEQLQALNKIESKLTNSEISGTQNFRYINAEAEILQGTEITINYLISALNVGEVDYTSETLAKVSEKAIENNTTTKQEILNLSKEVAVNEKAGVVELGKYLGTSYYTGNGDEKGDVVVKSKVRQVVDYVDNDATFSEANNMKANHMWRNTTITELTGSGYADNRLIDINVIPGYDIVDDNGVSYITESKNNLIISVDSQATDIDSNAGFESDLVPYAKDTENYKSQIELTVTKTTSAQTDTDNLTFDNIAEIVKYENDVGRKDIVTLSGNANPKIGEFKAGLQERDASATELITFAPPTGTETTGVLTVQILMVTIIALGIVVGGIIIIKKKVLRK